MSLLTPEKGMFKEPYSVWGKLWLAIMIIVFTTRMPIKTTLVNYYMYFEGFWYMFITAFSFIYLAYVLFQRKGVDEMNYLYVMMFSLPVLSAVAANLAEGQSIPGGLIAQRHWFGLGGIFLIIYLFKANMFTIKDFPGAGVDGMAYVDIISLLLYISGPQRLPRLFLCGIQ